MVSYNAAYMLLPRAATHRSTRRIPAPTISRALPLDVTHTSTPNSMRGMLFVAQRRCLNLALLLVHLLDAGTLERVTTGAAHVSYTSAARGDSVLLLGVGLLRGSLALVLDGASSGRGAEHLVVVSRRGGRW